MKKIKKYYTKDNSINNKNKIKSKFKFIIVGIIIILILFLIFNYKKIFSGNNIDRTSEGISNYILNISSYKAKATITVASNKNKNRYIINQEYTRENNVFIQTVEAPENIKGLKIVYDGDKLSIKNTALNLNEIYENYEYVSENALCLYNFIEDYVKSEYSETKENENQVIMNTKTKNDSNKYMMYKTLYIDKQTLKPTKLEIKDLNQNVLIYIEYNEIEINSTNKEEILAFNINDMQV